MKDSMTPVRNNLVRAVVFMSATCICLSTGKVPAAPAVVPPLVITPNEFDGTDVGRINRAIDAAAAGCRGVIPRVNVSGRQRQDVWLIDSAILLRSHTILIGGSLSDSILTNIVQYGSSGKAMTVASGPEYVRDVTTTNVCVIKN